MAGRTVFQVDQTKPEDQIVCGHQQEYGYDTDLDCFVRMLLAFLKYQSKLQKSTQQILRLLQLNLFEKRDLMALLRGDPPRDNQPDINQMVLL